jgi:hypothetical protein
MMVKQKQQGECMKVLKVIVNLFEVVFVIMVQFLGTFCMGCSSPSFLIKSYWNNEFR